MARQLIGHVVGGTSPGLVPKAPYYLLLQFLLRGGLKDFLNAGDDLSRNGQISGGGLLLTPVVSLDRTTAQLDLGLSSPLVWSVV